MRPSETLVLRPSRLKMLALLLGSAVFTAGGVAMIDAGNGSPLVWSCVLLSGFGVFAALLNLVGDASSLTLTPDGFAVKTLYRVHSYRWADVAGFGVTTLHHGHGSTRMVGFDFDPSFDRHRLGRSITRFIGAHEGCLPDTYGMRAEVLAELMAQWHARAMGRQQPLRAPLAGAA